MNSKQKRQNGFSTLQLIITIAIAVIMSGFAVVGITSARAHVRRSNSARQFAAFAERARADSVRRHAGSGQEASIQQIDATTYAVTMDFDSSGTVTTRNLSTESGVTINMPRTITFDWRGRITTETNVSFTNNLPGSVSVNISGSGDVTLDLEIFADGSIPNPALNGTGGSVITDPTPTPDPNATPSPSPSPSPSSSPSPESSPSPDPNATPSPVPESSPSPSPYPSTSPTPYPSASPTPTVAPCSISASPTSITIGENGSTSVSVRLNNFSGSGTITATSSNTGQLQVSPGSATVSGSNPASFTISVKRQSASATFSSSCGSQTVDVTIQ